MWIPNKYTTWYNNIINDAKRQDRVKNTVIYYERHHIIPASLGGSNLSDNLVLLTAKEHYICHLLLTKMVASKRDYYKMVHALFCFNMNYKHCRTVIPSVVIIKLRKKLSEVKMGVASSFRGSTRSADTKAKMSDNHWSKRGGIHGMLGKNHSTDSIQKLKNTKNSKYYWKAVSPDNNIYYFHSIRDFIQLHNLQIDFILKYLNTGKRVPEVVNIKQHLAKERRFNTTGWLFFRQLSPF